MQKLKKTFVGSNFCLVCGVDSMPVIYTFLFTVFGVLVASVLILMWAKANGKFANTKEIASLPLKAEEDKEK